MEEMVENNLQNIEELPNHRASTLSAIAELPGIAS